VWSDDSGLHSTAIQADGVVTANVSLAGVDASWRDVRLRWWVPASLGALTVERLDPGAAWTRRGIASSVGEGLVAFEDTDVRPGVRYGYRLRPALDGSDLAASETWVDVPARPLLSLVIANPLTTDRAVATVTLPAGTGTLELFDPMGRRIERLALSSSEERQRVEFTSRLRGAGVYLVRLTDRRVKRFDALRQHPLIRAFTSRLIDTGFRLPQLRPSAGTARSTVKNWTPGMFAKLTPLAAPGAHVPGGSGPNTWFDTG
jgi:hypothetical protein